YVYAMWLMLQQSEPDDYVVATGEMHTVREFVEEASKILGFDIEWEGEGIDETGIDTKTGQVLVQIDPMYFRPSEVDILIGDYSKARDRLGWKPEVRFPELVKIMVEADLETESKKIGLGVSGYG
ncbi:MAG TPA: GDP-mannose 4,6-dehydratase, partial [Armatimonadota bacterium]|nr:GDP-mannose 4,6-dehydratase [Armatimonadota bacterium]